jgi:hypothetical protein
MTSPTGSSSRFRRAAPLLLLGAVVLIAALLTGPGREAPPLDPRSTSPDGTKGLVDSLRALGAQVDVGATEVDEEVDVALLLTDDLDEEDGEALLTWVSGGGVLVVSDPFSDLVPQAVGSAAVGGFAEAPVSRECDLPALAEVEEVLPASGSVVYEAPAGAAACFPRDGGHWLVAQARGQGTIVALGGPDVFVNGRLDGPGHPELMAALLVPTGEEHVAFLRPRRPGEGDAALLDLIGDNVRLFALQLALAFLLYAAWRARRLGRPVEELQPVSIPASEAVTALGNLFHETGARRRAADLLRADVRRTFAERLGVPPDAPIEHLAGAVAARTGSDSGTIARTLSDDEPADEAALVALAQEAERLRSATLTSTSAPERSEQPAGP